MLEAAKQLNITNKEYRARQLAEGTKKYKEEGARPMKRAVRAKRLTEARAAEKERA